LRVQDGAGSIGPNGVAEVFITKCGGGGWGGGGVLFAILSQGESKSVEKGGGKERRMQIRWIRRTEVHEKRVYARSNSYWTQKNKKGGRTIKKE